MTINAEMLSKMFLAAAKNLDSKKEWINELNVFPVPDGDTGTNMTMTIMSAAREVAAIQNPDMASVCKAISSGSLRGARGNSGVILSQLLRGFTKGVKEYDEVDASIITDAFQKAVETAYKAVMKPKEGTILTVAKGMADKALELNQSGVEDLAVFFEEIIKTGDVTLEHTPDLLPVLKEAGVVDSGGQGLMQVMKGAYDLYMGKEMDLTVVDIAQMNTPNGAGTMSSSAPLDGNYQAQANANIKYGYCTEFIILLNKTFNVKMEMDFKSYLESIGDSIVCVADEDLVKIHVHTNDPGLAIQKALKYGMLSNMKIDNMRLEHEEKLFKMREDGTYELREEEPETAPQAEEDKPMEHKDTAFIATSVGDGMSEIFKGLGVDYIVEGGQTMNPSTEDFLDAIAKVNADTIFILPNNKNIIMAANQARDLTEDKRIVVIPTKTVPQGITAVINYIPDLSADENESTMIEEIAMVKTGQVTYAVRDTSIDGKEIKQGDYMGIGDSGMLAVGSSIPDVTFDMIRNMVGEDSELISIYYGAETSEEEAEALSAKVSEAYPGCDIELQAGGQPIYYYIVSVE
ncbi:MAG: DAK2 domain-containing protein [Lachnospiraceae bacterium]|nr:DAK2 domain-containing protein [Lachnospiraceae bacterium]